MTVLWRLHLRGLLTDRSRSLLAAAGLAIGVALVVAVLVLGSAIGRPFDPTATILRAPPQGQLVEVTPALAGRLAADRAAALAAVPGVERAVPVIVEPIPLRSGSADAGALLLAADGCALGPLLAADPCAALAGRAPVAGPGVALAVSRTLAGDLGVDPGAPLALPGMRPGAAHVGLVVDDDTLPGVPGRRFALAGDLAGTQRLLGRGPVVTSAYVVVADDAARDRVRAAVGDAGTVGPPAAPVPTALVTVQQALGGLSAAGIVVGVLVAVGSVVLAVDARRSTIATALAVGADRRRLLAGFAAEGAVLGGLGGLGGLPLGHALGSLLVHRFGGALLAGTGAVLDDAFSPTEIGAALGAGMLTGIVAVGLTARGVVRAGALAALDGHGGGRARARTVPAWLVPTGVALAAVAVVTMARFGEGRLPFASGQSGLMAGVTGALLVTLALTPRLVRPAAAVLGRLRPADGLLVRAELDRLPVRSAVTVTTLALGAALAVAFASIAPLGARTTTDRFADVVGDGLLVSAQAPWDQREGVIGDDVAAAVAALPGVDTVSARWRAVVPSPTEPRLVMAVDGPAADRSVTGVDAAAVGGDRVALSRIAAARLGAGAGGTVVLPTLTGRSPFTVVGVFDPVAVDDSTVGDWVLTDPGTARTRFGAVRAQLVVQPRPGAAADGLAERIRHEATLVVHDRASWRAQAETGLARYFEPFRFTGALVVVAAAAAVANMLVLGLVQMRRTRATVRALGGTVAGERRTLLAQTALLAVLATGFGLAWSQFFVWLLSLSSPVYYGFALQWGVAGSPLGAGALVTLGLAGVAGALALPLVGRRPLVASLRAE